VTGTSGISRGWGGIRYLDRPTRATESWPRYRYAAMMHVAALRVLGFERIYAAIIPANIASRRMLEKLGYEVDQSQRAASLCRGRGTTS